MFLTFTFTQALIQASLTDFFLNPDLSLLFSPFGMHHPELIHNLFLYLYKVTPEEEWKFGTFRTMVKRFIS